ncbi:MAG: aldo/keto reductase family protein [Phycisphaerales bacterium]|nr:aldo/keto reductase family protein [Phycisphaerales bacterium]
MEYRRLGHAGVKLSEIGLGSWLTYGGGVTPEVAADCLRTAFEAGINFIDTADIYHRGRSEEVLGELLVDYRRQDIFLATKVFWPMSDNINDRGLCRKHIIESIDNSLRRLRTDYVDLYQCHRFDSEVGMYEVVRTMDDLTRQGKVLYWGVSEWPALEIKNAVAMARQINAYPPVSNQPEYSIASRRVETNGAQSACDQDGLGMVVWSPLRQGILTGKYSGGAVPKDSRLADDNQNQFVKQIINDDVLGRVDKLRPIADRHGMSLAQLAIRWLLYRKAVTSVIIGASKPSQVTENVNSLNYNLDEADRATIDELFPAAQFQ